MSSTYKTDDVAKVLSKIALEPAKRRELWDTIEQRMDMVTQQNGIVTPTFAKKRKRFNLGQLAAAAAALVVTASGITYGVHYESLLKTTKSTGTTNITSVPTPKLTIQLTLTLPNGQILKPDQTVAWRDLSLSLIITSLPPADAGSQIFSVIMGDQTNRISQETVSTSIGSGELWYTQRKDSTYSYYAIVNGSQNAYVLQAVVIGNPRNAKNEVTSLLNNLHLNGDKPTQQGNSSYERGLTKTQSPNVPSSYEASILPKNGYAQIVSGTGNGVVTYGQSWTTSTDFSSSPLSINGVDYAVPKQYRNMQLFVLPIDKGIVWAPTNQRNFNMQNLDFTGYTDIYFTPYHSSQGSLSDGAQLIAKVPHKWTGFDGPVVGSAWTGWLPQNSVVMPKVQSEVVRLLSYSSINNMKVVGQYTKNFSPAWSSLFMHNVPQNPASKADYSADVGSLTRTSGGFVLQVGFTDATRSGRNSGMQGQGAYYYWSEKTWKWTPLTQLYMVQTVTGDLSVGSGAVYWEEAVPDSQGGKKNILDVAQMHYDPQTNTMQSVWLGNWYYSPSFVDDRSWITVLPEDMKPAGTQPMFTVFTP